MNSPHKHVDEISVKEKPDHDKTIAIIINGRKVEVAKKILTFEEIVNLAFDGNPMPGPTIVFTVLYNKGEGGKQGTLLPGDSIKIKEGMVFHVTRTDKS